MQVIAKALGVPCTEYAFEDSWLGDHATRLGLHPSYCLLEWNSLRHAVRIARDQAKVPPTVACMLSAVVLVVHFE